LISDRSCPKTDGLGPHHRLVLKAGTWATKETIRFGGNPDHIALGLGQGCGYGK